MRNIYFKTAKNQRALAHRIIHFSSYWLTRLSPFLSEQVAKKTLANPFARRKYQMRTRLVAQTHLLEIASTQINLLEFNDAQVSARKNVLLCHGWGDSCTRFTQLIDYFIDQGYRVWVFDQIGHGKSQGKFSHLFAFIEATKAVLSYLQSRGSSADTVIGHSMGALAVLNLPNELLASRQVVLISMPAYLFNDMYKAVTAIGVAELMLTNLLDRLAKAYGVSWQSLTASKHIDKIGEHFLLIHDESDKVCTVCDLKELLQAKTYALYVTKGLGHIKLLKDPALMSRLSVFIETGC